MNRLNERIDYLIKSLGMKKQLSLKNLMYHRLLYHNYVQGLNSLVKEQYRTYVLNLTSMKIGFELETVKCLSN